MNAPRKAIAEWSVDGTLGALICNFHMVQMLTEFECDPHNRWSGPRPTFTKVDPQFRCDYCCTSDYDDCTHSHTYMEPVRIYSAATGRLDPLTHVKCCACNSILSIHNKLSHNIGA